MTIAETVAASAAKGIQMGDRVLCVSGDTYQGLRGTVLDVGTLFARVAIDGSGTFRDLSILRLVKIDADGREIRTEGDSPSAPAVQTVVQTDDDEFDFAAWDGVTRYCADAILDDSRVFPDGGVRIVDSMDAAVPIDRFAVEITAMIARRQDRRDDLSWISWFRIERYDGDGKTILNLRTADLYDLVALYVPQWFSQNGLPWTGPGVFRENIRKAER